MIINTFLDIHFQLCMPWRAADFQFITGSITFHTDSANFKLQTKSMVNNDSVDYIL